MPFLFRNQVKLIIRNYLCSMLFYVDNLPADSYKRIAAYVDAVDVFTYTKYDAMYDIRQYLKRMSSYADIRLEEVYKKICTDTVAHLIVPL